MSSLNSISDILNENGNVVICASAGTGKTSTIVERIKNDYINSNNYQTYAAITFTNKAAEELKHKISSAKNAFIGTCDSFILNEVINPFAKDICRQMPSIKLKVDYSNNHKKESSEELVKQFKENGIIGKYIDNKKNFAFKLALKVLKKSHAASRYLKCKYSRIYIDEYQDSDMDMHNFFMYLCDELSIPMFVVGDDKQSIYRWRGAYPEGFKSLLNKNNFKVFRLSSNFRSNKQIQNYSFLFDESIKDNSVFSSFALKDEVCFLNFDGNDNNNFQNKIEHWLGDGKIEKVAVLTYRHEDAQYCANCFSDLNFVYIPRDPFYKYTINNEQVWLMKNITRYLVEEHYNEYSFLNEIPYFDYESDINITRKIKKVLKDIKYNKNNEDLLKDNIWKLYEIVLQDSIYNDSFNEEFGCLKETLDNEEYKLFFNADKYKRIATTIHSAKGLSFDRVIILDYDFNEIIDNKDKKNLHYVAITRAKEKLLILTQNINESNYFNYVYYLITSRDLQFNDFIKDYDEVYANQHGI